MTKKELIDHLVETTGLSRSQAMAATDAALRAIEDALCRGEHVMLRGFATFRLQRVKEKVARDISRGISVRIPACRTVRLNLSKELKERLNS